MLEEITEVLRNFMYDDSLEVTESTTFEEIGLDSLEAVHLVMEIENEFGISIEMNHNIRDISAVMRIIEAAKKKEAA